MNDLKGALRTLSQRGAEVGSVRLRERVAFELAAGSSSRLRSGSKRRLPGPVIAMVAAAVVLALFGIFAFIVSRSDESPVVEEPQVTVPLAPTSPPPTAAPPTTTAQADTAWLRVSDDPAVFRPPDGRDAEIVMERVIAGGPGFTAAGSINFGCTAGPETCEHRPAIWTSPDGSGWERVAWNVDIFGGGEISDLTSGGPGLVAVGRASREDERITWSVSPRPDGLSGSLERTWVPRDAAIWTSSDGNDWTRVPHDDQLFGSARIMHVSVVGERLVAVGETDRLTVHPDDHVFLCDGVPVDPEGVECTPRQVVWTSNDGLSWEKSPIDLQIDALDTAGGQFLAIGRGPESMCETLFIPEFYLFEGRCSGPPAAWYSQDGITWTLSDSTDGIFVPPDGGTYTQALGLAVSGRTAIAILIHHGPGEHEWGRGLWVSEDEGRTWIPAPVDDLGSHSDTLEWVAPTETGFIIGAGETISGDPPTLFTSQDGFQWDALPLPTEPGDWLSDAIGVPGQLVVVGTAGGPAAVVLTGPNP